MMSANSLVTCDVCKREMPIWSLRCIGCGEKISELVTLYGQLAYVHGASERKFAMALRRQGEQVETVGTPRLPDHGEQGAVVLLARVRGRGVEFDVRIPVADIVDAAQSGSEVVDVS